MSKQINPYLGFVLGLDATQFDSLCDAINQRKDRERYGANVIKLSKINNIGFYLATGKALFLMKYFFSHE